MREISYLVAAAVAVAISHWIAAGLWLLEPAIAAVPWWFWRQRIARQMQAELALILTETEAR
jgi:hypothetical protein